MSHQHNRKKIKLVLSEYVKGLLELEEVLFFTIEEALLHANHPYHRKKHVKIYDCDELVHAHCHEPKQDDECNETYA